MPDTAGISVCGDAVPASEAAVRRDGGRGRPRICQLLEGAAAAETGALAGGLVDQFRSSYDFSFVYLGEPGRQVDEFRRAGFPVQVIGRRPGRKWDCSRRLADALQRGRVDLIHAHQSSAFYHALIARSFYRSAPILFTEHRRRYPDHVSPKRVVVNRMFLESRDRIVATSLAVREALILNDGLPAERVEVVYHGVPRPLAADAATDGQAVRREIGVEPDALLILQPARFETSQNHTLALQALEQVLRNLPKTRLVLVGEGPEQGMLGEMTRRWGLEPYVLFLGPRTDHDRILAAADLVLLTGSSDGDLVTIVRALAAGVPVVATRAGGVAEVVEDRSCGLIASPGDYSALAENIHRLGTSLELRAQYGRRGRERAAALFSGAKTSLRYSELYGNMLAR
jgi:glycosyltransferase involved in cell wall biosynthesis